MDELPNEVLFKIISLLDVEDVVTVSRVSTRYRDLASENSLWKDLFDIRFVLPVQNNSGAVPSWRNAYCIHHQVDTNLKRGKCEEPFKLPKRAARLNNDIQAFFTSENNNLMEDTITLVFPYELSISKVVISATSSGLNVNPIQNFDFHSDDILTVEANSHIIVSASLDNLVNVCDLKNGNLLHTLEGHNKPVNCIQIDVEQDLLITADVEGVIMLWCITTGHCLRTLTGHTDEICCMKQKGPWIVTGSHDKTVRVWNTSGQALHQLIGHGAYINCVAFDFVPGEETGFIVSGDRQGRICVWNLHDGTWLHDLFTRSAPVEICCLDFDLTSTTCIFTASDGSVSRFDVINQVTIQAENRHQNIAYAMHWSKNQNRLITAGYDGAVMIWDTSNNGLQLCNRMEYSQNVQVPEKFFWLAVSPSNRFVVITARSKQIFVLDFGATNKH